MTNDSPPEQSEVTPRTPALRIDIAALQGSLMAALQRLLDVVAISGASIGRVSEADYAMLPSFPTVIASAYARLPLSLAVEEALSWHLRTAFRDALEATGLYLDGCREVAAIYREASARTLTVGVLNRISGPEATKFHGLGIPAKLEALRKDFGLAMDLMDYVLSINKIRNCLVHRMGVVGDRDADDQGQLTLTYRALEFFGPDPKGGPDVIVDRPGVALPENAPLMLRARDIVKTFSKGERIVLSHRELLQVFLTIIQFAMVLTGELRARAATSPSTDEAKVGQEA